MKVIRTHHRYELENFEDPAAPGQILQFIEKERITPESPELRTVSDGTTNEEVLRVLIDRLRGLYAKFPSHETKLAILRIEAALEWLEKRTADRKGRGVEGKAAA
jgi:hypothetical protein